MGLLQNSITWGTPPDDVYYFDDLNGNLNRISEKLEKYGRPGLPDYSLRKTGLRAEESTITTIHYVLDRSAARDAMDAYANKLLDGNPHKIFQHDSDRGFYFILGIQEQSQEASFSVVGALIPNAQILQKIQWRVVHVADPAP